MKRFTLALLAATLLSAPVWAQNAPANAGSGQEQSSGSSGQSGHKHHQHRHGKQGQNGSNGQAGQSGNQ